MDMESISPAWSTTSDQAWEHIVLQALNARRGDSDTRVASGTHRDPRLKFLIGQQLIKICNGARQTLLKHSAGLPIEQLLGARNVGPALLRIVLRPRPVNDARVRASQIDHHLDRF